MVVLWHLVNTNMKEMSVKAVKCHLKYRTDQGLKLQCRLKKINMPDSRDVTLSGHFYFRAITLLYSQSSAKAEMLGTVWGALQIWHMPSVSSHQSPWPLLPQRLLRFLYSASYNCSVYISQRGQIQWPHGHSLPCACWCPSCLQLGVFVRLKNKEMPSMTFWMFFQSHSNWLVVPIMHH